MTCSTNLCLLSIVCVSVGCSSVGLPPPAPPLPVAQASLPALPPYSARSVEPAAPRDLLNVHDPRAQAIPPLLDRRLNAPTFVPTWNLPDEGWMRREEDILCLTDKRRPVITDLKVSVSNQLCERFKRRPHVISQSRDSAITFRTEDAQAEYFVDLHLPEPPCCIYVRVTGRRKPGVDQVDDQTLTILMDTLAALRASS